MVTEQAAQLARPCQRCGNPCVGWAVQLVRRGRIRWEVEWECDCCGTAAHDGDWGQSPAEVRSAILAQHGSHCLKLADSEVRGAGIIKAFRSVFEFSIPDALASANQLRQSGYEGTYVEVRLLNDVLREAGISAIVYSGSCIPEPG